MRKVFFNIPDYPDWKTGGNKYHTIVFEYFKKKIPGVYTYGHNKFTGITEKFKLLKIISGLYYTIKIPKLSIIITTNTSFLHCFIPVLLNKYYKKHYYFLIVHHLVQDENPSFLRKKFEDHFISKADQVITVSTTTQKKLLNLNLGLKNIEIIKPGLDVNISERIRNPKFQDMLKLLYVGTIEERKGIIYLIEALSLLDSSKIELNIIGEAPYSKFYYDQITEAVRKGNLESVVFFRGKVSRDELIEYYMNSEIFVFPSLWEGYGMVVAESMAYGLPVIASRIPAIEELIEDGFSGLLFEAKNSEQLSEKIKLLSENKELRNEITKNAFKKARSFLNWNETSGRIMKLVTEIEK